MKVVSIIAEIEVMKVLNSRFELAEERMSDIKEFSSWRDKNEYKIQKNL